MTCRWVMLTSCQCLTTVLMSVPVEYVTDMKRIHTGQEQFFSCALSFCFLSHPPSLSTSRILTLSTGVKEYCTIIFIDNYQRQRACKQTGLAGVVLQQSLHNAATTHYTSIQCGQPVTQRFTDCSTYTVLSFEV